MHTERLSPSAAAATLLEELTMLTYLTLFTYAKESWRHLVQDPEDRAEAARKVVDAAGGRLVAFYWMLGEYDGLAIFEAPGAEAAAGVKAGIAASGRVARQQTMQLLTSAEVRRSLELAKVVASAYEPPGGARDWRAGYDELG